MSDTKAVRLAEDPWRVFKIMAEFVESFDTLSHLEAAVTVFGSARTKADDTHYKSTVALCEGLARQGIATVTGGGTGIMEARRMSRESPASDSTSSCPSSRRTTATPTSASISITSSPEKSAS